MWGLVCRGKGAEFRVQGPGLRALGFGLEVSGLLGSGFWCIFSAAGEGEIFGFQVDGSGECSVFGVPSSFSSVQCSVLFLRFVLSGSGLGSR